MKKIVTMMAVLAVAGIASADIALNALNQTPLIRQGFTTIGPGQGLEAGAFVQILWKADNVGYQSDDLDASLLNPGEYLLSSGNAGNVGLFNFATAEFGDADVGGNDILSGYFYARVFERDVVVPGDFFLEMGLTGNPLTAYNQLDPGTVYANNLGADVGDAWIDSQGTQVIPEPATIGLMGIAGLGMFLARKKSRR